MADERHVSAQRLYLKDLSFEAPNTPKIFQEEWKPDINVQLNSNAEAVGENLYEVVLTVTVTTKIGEEVAYLCEVAQAGVFEVKGFKGEELRRVLITFCPNLLLPFAREEITSQVARGSFPQFILQPVDFDAMYAQHQQEVAAAEGEAAAQPKH